MESPDEYFDIASGRPHLVGEGLLVSGPYSPDLSSTALQEVEQKDGWTSVDVLSYIQESGSVSIVSPKRLWRVQIEHVTLDRMAVSMV